MGNASSAREGADPKAPSYTSFGADDQFWKKVPLFQCLPESQYPELTACSVEVAFEAGATVIRQSDIGDEFFIIKEGVARVEVDGFQVGTVKTGDYFGENALLTDTPRTATVTCVTAAKALKITRTQFQEMGLHQQLSMPKREKVNRRHKMMASGAAGVKPTTDTEGSFKRNDLRSSVSGMDPGVMRSMSSAKRLKQTWRQFFELQGDALKDIFFDRINITSFVLVPLGQWCKYADYTPGIIFFANFLAIIPLASILGHATEELSSKVGQLVGGFLNATFGNAVEMIMCVQAVKAGLVRVVQGNLLGSILSNLLLVLGMSIFASGMVRRTQTFNQQGAASNMTCLLVASISICLPTVFHSVSEVGDSDNVLTISRISAVFLMAVYGMFLYFMLKTHADLFEDEGEEDDDEAELSQVFCISLLFVTTVVVFLCSQCLVDSIEDVSSSYGLSKAFIGVILLPIVGNAAEHATAVSCAHKGMMDLALGVAVGSSTQIALFVVPCAIMCGWYYDVPMDLSFSLFEMTCQMLTVFLVSQVLSHGQTNWLHGAMLMTVYVFIATQCLFIIEPDDI